MKDVFRDVFMVIRYIGAAVLNFIKYFFVGCYYIFSNKVTMMAFVIGLGISLVQISSGFREEIIQKEQEMFEVEVPSIDYYYDGIENVEINDNMAIMDMVDCYKGVSNLDELPNHMKDVISGLEKMYSSNSNYFSFLYQDLFSGFTISYNADAPIFTASTIKAPAMIYIYEMASLGKIDLNEKLLYTSKYYHGGSGILKNKSFNTSYTIEELIQYTIYESDNIAYKMLMDRYGQDNIYEFWNNKGTNYIFKLNTIWGYMSAKDALIYMKELYNFSKDNEEYGQKLLNHFKKAKWKMIADKNGDYNTANKGGWSGKAIHDVAIVFDKNPYVLIIMSNTGDSSYSYLFSETSKRVGNLHFDYWKYKVSLCSNIKLY